MKSLLKTLAVLRTVNYVNLVAAAVLTFNLAYEKCAYAVLAVMITAGLLIAALVINGLTIEIKRKLNQ